MLAIFTDHHPGVVRVLPYTCHLAVGLTVGVLFPALPFVLGFAGPGAAYRWMNEAVVVTVIALSKPEQAVGQPA